MKQFLAFIALATVAFGSAQTVPIAIESPAPGVTAYDTAVPRPEAVLGYVVGTRHTRSDQTREYFRAVDAASERVRVTEYGRSTDGKPLIYAVVTSPRNMARLEEIRLANLRLSEEASDVSDADLADMPTVLWMGYGVHGNENSATEAPLLYLYHLAAGQGPEVERALDEVVVLIDPLINPDGNDRFASWANMNRGQVATTDSQDREHNEAWPGGRTNYYMFDLNRDWLPVQQPESQARIRLYQAWRPQLTSDYHEMGGNNTYYFHPGIPTRNHPLTPEGTNRLTDAVSRFHARILDSIGTLYYTREQFDDFYFGKGSSYPDVNGGVGVLFEQGSSRGLRAMTQNGLLTFPMTIRNQFLTSWSMTEAAVALRPELLRNQRDFYRQVGALVEQSPVDGWIVSLEGAPQRAMSMLRALETHGVRAHSLAVDATVGGRVFRAGRAYVLPLDQPQGRLLLSAMERRTQFPDTGFYDVSTWSFPLAWNVTYAEAPEVPGSWLGSTRVAPEAREPFRSARVAYAMEWGDADAPRALYRLLEAGLRGRLTTQPKRVDGRTFERGVVLFPVVQDVPAERVHALLREVHERGEAPVHAIDTSLTNMGTAGADVGTPSARVLTLPRVALAAGPGVQSNNCGEAWHAMSVRAGIAVSLVDTSVLAETGDLDRYNVIVLTGGAYPEALAERLRPWIQAGGVLVATDGGADWAATSGLVNLTRRSVPMRTPDDARYGDLDGYGRAQSLTGAIFAAEVDPTHPLAAGLGETLPVFTRGSGFFAPGTAGTTVARFTAAPLMSGYATAETLDTAAGGMVFGAYPSGRGAVVLFAENPNFRAFFHGTQLAFFNAVFFGQTL